MTTMQSAIRDIQNQGWALLSAKTVTEGFGLEEILKDVKNPSFFDSWENLPRDTHLADGGRYRFRRHASLLQTFLPPANGGSSSLMQVPYRPHWQPLLYNKLHGGRFRHFAPITEQLTDSTVYHLLVTRLGEWFCTVKPTQQWFIEAHQFRIDASQGPGRPTPEGPHRDGVDFVALLLIRRGTLRGGVTTIHTLEGETLVQTTLLEPFTLMLLDDNRVAHATTPIEADGPLPMRDTLVITYRSGGFLEPSSFLNPLSPESEC